MVKRKTMAVIGLGYVGLPVATLAAAKGWRVLGVDIDEEKVKRVSTKEPKISASIDPAAVAEADFVIVAVPTPVDENHEPDLNPLITALKGIEPHLSDGQVLSIESTINPGVMDEVIQPLVQDTGVHLVHCPERINPGDDNWTVMNIARVIGGYTAKGVNLAKKYYESIIDAEIMVMGSVTEAEAVKILENTFRDINIAFINEMAQSFDKLGINITNVIAGATTKPFAFMPHYPGNGVGGHCISVDPYYMIDRARQVGFDHKFLKLAREINNSMPAYAVATLINQLKELGKKPADVSVALLGLAYKKNIDDIRESPALAIKEILDEAGFKNIVVFDPYCKNESTEGLDSLVAALQQTDTVMLATDHDEFTQGLTADVLVKNNIIAVLDGKNSLDMEAIKKAGISYHGIGR